MTATAMTRHEREDLQRLVRQLEKAQKGKIKLRSTELLAEFENQMGSIYHPEDDPIWQRLEQETQKHVDLAQRKITERSRELGIAAQFAPSLNFHWVHRGYSNGVKQRREELRAMAKTRIAADEQRAIVEVELRSANAQLELAKAGLTSDAARAFLENLPTAEALMPPLKFEEIAGPADPPIAEQLVSPAALRQRRYRLRHGDGPKALRDGHGDALDGEDGGEP